MSKSVLPPRKLYQDYIRSSGLTEKEKEDVLRADEEASKHPYSLEQKLAQIAQGKADREKIRVMRSEKIDAK